MIKNNDYPFYEEDTDMEIENDCLSPKECMEYLFIGRSLFYKLVNSGELPAFRVGKLWRVKKTDLEKYCIENKKKNLARFA